MDDVVAMLSRSGMDVGQVRRRIYRATDARERERWHALWLLAQGWSAALERRHWSGGTGAAALERDAHTIGAWVAAVRAHGPHAVSFDQTGGSPPALTAGEQAVVKTARGRGRKPVTTPRCASRRARSR